MHSLVSLVLVGGKHVQCTLQGEPWAAVIKGHELDPMTQQQDQQRLMLERFQREVSPGRSTLPALGLLLHPAPQLTVCVCLYVLLAATATTQHPGFDFSGATFNGAVPNARTFMGGLPSDATR
jgi:hypothetical protein